MAALPVIFLLLVAVGLGTIMGLRYLKGEKNKPTMIGLHFLFGAGGLEVLVMLMAGSPDGSTASSGPSAGMAAAFIAAALIMGLIAALTARQLPKALTALLGIHVSIALAGVALVLFWAASL
jgi:biotin transporter BioY